MNIHHLQNFRKTLFILLLSLSAVLMGTDRSNRESRRPVNVVIIYVHDMGWKDINCYGSTFYETLNIDALARRGVRFTDAYSACKIRATSLHALLAGKYPALTHFTNIPMKLETIKYKSY